VTREENEVLAALVEIRDSDLSYNSKLVAFTLQTYRDQGPGPVPFPTVHELATMVRLTPSATRNALQSLLGLGMLPATRMRDFRDPRWDDQAGEGSASSG
jgi:hypothetical protein